MISCQLVGRAEETSTYSSSGFYTVNCQPPASNYQLSHLRPCWESPPPPASEVGGESVTTRHWGPIRINNVSMNSVPRCSELLLVSKIPHECKNLGFLKGKGGCSLQG